MSGMNLAILWCYLVENGHGKLPSATQTAVHLPGQRALLLLNSLHLQPWRPCQIPLSRAHTQSGLHSSGPPSSFPPTPPTSALPITCSSSEMNSSSSPHTPCLHSIAQSWALGFYGPGKFQKHIWGLTSGCQFCFARKDT